MLRCCLRSVPPQLGGRILRACRLYSSRIRAAQQKYQKNPQLPAKTAQGTRHLPTLSPASTRPTPPRELAALRTFLAPGNLASQSPLTYTPAALSSLYDAVKPLRHQPNPLNCYELNQLLVLFGTLSVPEPRPKCIYNHSFVSRMVAAPFRKYWPLVVELSEQIRIKEKRKPRTGAHHYWAMRAHLARIRVTANEQIQEGDSRLAAASNATVHYLFIRSTADPAVHLPYLETMFLLRFPKHLPKLVEHLCKSLDLYANPHHRFTDLLWRVILTHGGDLDPTLKARFLSTLWTRLTTYPDVLNTRMPKPTRYAFDTISMHHIRLGVTTSQLCSAFTSALFPHFSVLVPPEVWKWAARQTKAVFSPENPLETRWTNLVLLSLYAAPPKLSNVGGAAGVTLDNSTDDASTAWRIVFAVSMFERTIGHGTVSDDPADPVRLAVRRLWRMWKDTDVDAPSLVQRVVVGAFLRLATKTGDAPLMEGCRRYCVAHTLWGSRQGGTRLDVAQTTEMLVDYVFAALYTSSHPREDLWPAIFAALPPNARRVRWHQLVANALFREFLPRDWEIARELYVHCQEFDIRIFTDSVHALSLILADRLPHDALQFLGNKWFSLDQLEELLDRILRTLRRERHAFRDVKLADALVPALVKLYKGTNRIPRTRTKFSIRYALNVLAESDHSLASIKLLRIVHRRQPTFFSIHYFLRMMRALVNRQQPNHAVELLELVRDFPPLASENFRRKLTFRLVRKGAFTLANIAYRFNGVLGVRRTTRESLVRAVRFRLNAAPIWMAERVLQILTRRPRHVPTLKLAMMILVRAGRFQAARHLLARAHLWLDADTLTWLGNTILNAAIMVRKPKYGTLVRHILNVRDYLVRWYDFRQDRITINILLKALLRWKTYMDAPKIRALFDHMVRSGYPAGAHWRKEGGVPFGSKFSSTGNSINTMNLPAFVSFDRHVRPMYRMFIKALHLQEDRRGARTIVGILDEVRREVLARRQKQRRARLVGLWCKKARVDRKLKSRRRKPSMGGS
ncbi:hypothetical protein C8J57DRAFT_1119879 [Mycena rebaudengoi]|nr:hypothetical protein C8J57DRAFT_1119879 [Mycena rebaudengoi]